MVGWCSMGTFNDPCLGCWILLQVVWIWRRGCSWSRTLPLLMVNCLEDDVGPTFFIPFMLDHKLRQADLGLSAIWPWMLPYENWWFGQPMRYRICPPSRITAFNRDDLTSGCLQNGDSTYHSPCLSTSMQHFGSKVGYPEKSHSFYHHIPHSHYVANFGDLHPAEVDKVFMFTLMPVWSLV